MSGQATGVTNMLLLGNEKRGQDNEYLTEKIDDVVLSFCRQIYLHFQINRGQERSW